MSTKSSLILTEFDPKKTYYLHIYEEGMDSCYYIENPTERLKLPSKEVAEVLANALKQFQEEDK